MKSRVTEVLNIVGVLFALACSTSAQTTQTLATAAPSVAQAFEVATIKLAHLDAVPKNQLVRVSSTRISIASMSLTWLIYSAYGDGGYNTSMSVRGGPDWVNKTAFSIEALSSAPATPLQQRLMLQKLLSERFGLKIRHEEETNDVLGLVVDRRDGTLGPRVRKWDGTCPAVMPALYLQAPRRPLLKIDDHFVAGPASPEDDIAVAYCPTGYRANGGIRIDGATMATVADVLSLPPGRAALGGVAQDRTGLTERYTMELDYGFNQTPAAPAPGCAPAACWRNPGRRSSRAMGIEIRAHQGPVEGHRRRKRTAADGKLSLLVCHAGRDNFRLTA